MSKRHSPLLEKIEQKLTYHFSDVTLLDQALTHRSAKGAHNERLEFLGDSVLGCVIANHLYHQFERGDEGQLTRLRAQLVKEQTLAELANELDLQSVLKLGSGELKSGGFRRASILSDAMEAVIGAIYLDADFQTAENVVISLYRSRLSQLSLAKAVKDPKTRLQEWLQQRKRTLPTYQVIEESGADHNKSYRVACQVDGMKNSTEGTGTSRRKAEQSAALKMLEELTNA